MELLLAGGSVVSLGPHEHALAHVRKLELWALMMKPLLINEIPRVFNQRSRSVAPLVNHATLQYK